ncbi:MAG: hypothetical protein ACOCV2_04740 [Persicimonas sp.]
MKLRVPFNMRVEGHPTGSALILALLIMLVLSAIGMLALHDVAASNKQSGVYRMRTQAQNMADGAAEFVGQESGANADEYWALMQKQHEGQIENLSDQDNMEMDSRMQETVRGSYVRLNQRADDGYQGHFADYFLPSEDETGLLGGSGSRSFESREDYSEFGLVLRDPIEGPSVPGYDEKFCFKKVTLATRGHLSQEPNGDEMVSMAERRNGVEAYIGPIDCGSR